MLGGMCEVRCSVCVCVYMFATARRRRRMNWPISSIGVTSQRFQLIANTRAPGTTAKTFERVLFHTARNKHMRIKHTQTQTRPRSLQQQQSKCARARGTRMRFWSVCKNQYQLRRACELARAQTFLVQFTYSYASELVPERARQLAICVCLCIIY